MFAQLLGEIKNLSSGMAALHEAQLITSEAEQDDGQAERADDDEAWLNAELDAQRNAEQADDQLSLDTRVNNLITTQSAQQILSKPHVLTSIAQDLAVEEKTSQAINDELAAILSSLLKERLAEDKLQEKLKKYPRPANVEFLKTPRVNPLIWGQISQSTRTGDAKSQKFQHVLIGAVNAVVKATDYILNKGGEQELLTMLTDSIAFMLQCNHEYNHSRRLAMKRDVHKDFAALCNVHTPSGEYLFGDLSKATKEITDANKLAKKVRPAGTNPVFGRGNRGYTSYASTSRSQRRFQPYQRTKNTFFDKGRFPPTRKKGNPNK